MTQEWERLLRCSECGALDWSCQQVESDNVLSTMRLHLTCKHCHARFSLPLGEQGLELMMPLAQKDQADQDYLLYTLREMHEAQARLSLILIPPYMPREIAIRDTLNHVVETIDAMTGYIKHLETGEPLASPLNT